MGFNTPQLAAGRFIQVLILAFLQNLQDLRKGFSEHSVIMNCVILLRLKVFGGNLQNG